MKIINIIRQLSLLLPTTQSKKELEVYTINLIQIFAFLPSGKVSSQYSRPNT